MSTISFDFRGKGIVVTGGAQGIGFEIARRFLASGASVSIWDYSAEALKAAETEIAKNPDHKSRAFFCSVDVTQMASCAAAAAKLPFALDVLVNNAGITRDKSFVKMTEEDWSAVINTNLTGLFNVTQSALPKFSADSKNKRIVNMASIVALYGNFGQTNYAAAKAGVIGMTKTWAREFGKRGFTVNAIAPGFIETRMTSAMPKEALASMVAKIPAARMGQVSDIANACLFLASEDSSYVNGTVLNVDGGLVV
ncbi:MAG: 3-oxoacyl-ACP reductase FabG [Oligoflexia bacterium]|nr:3-oxoacyl-ACP reductase FabG [Oligoflexia bacterium]